MPIADDRRPVVTDLVLDTRLRGLRANLERVMEVLRATEARGEAIREIQRHLGKNGIGDLARRARATVGIVKLRLETRQIDEAVATLDEAAGLLETVVQAVEQSAASLSRLEDQRVEFEPDIVRTLEEHLVDEAGRKVTALENLEDTLARLRRQGEAAAGGAGLRALWSDYRELVEEQTAPLFAEYVDFLRGLALRDSGLDEGICSVADRLLLDRLDKVEYGFSWSSLAIPDHRGSTPASRARFVRLGFPEWTIWALPLAAQQFGKILISTHEDLRRNLADDLAADLPGGMARQHLEDCLADAFATFSMGPAYACAAVLMELDPVPPAGHPGPSPDDARAAMIFEIWRRADDRAPNDSFGTDLRERLEAEWRTAIAQAGGAAGAGGEEHPGGEEREGGAAPAPPALPADVVPAWADRIWQWLERRARYAAYPPSSWTEKAFEWSERLLVEADVEPRDTDIRDVLNAAWRCRVENPGRVDEIAEAAARLWGRMLARARPGAGREAGVQAGFERRSSQTQDPRR